MISPLKKKLNELNKAIEKAELSHEVPSVLDKLHAEKLQLLREAIDLLYEEYGYEMISYRISTLHELDEAKRNVIKAEEKVKRLKGL